MSDMSLIPKHPSNRRLIERMTAWGWVVVRQRGDKVEMNITVTAGSRTVMVNAPTFHDGNPTTTFKEVIEVTCGGDVVCFWGATAEEIRLRRRPAAVTVAPAKPRPRPRPTKPSPPPRIRVPQTQTQTQTQTEEATVPDTNQQQPDHPEPKAPRQRGIAEAVLTYLLDGRTRTVTQVVEATGFTRDQVSGAMYNLTKTGAVRRIKTGVYQVEDQLAAAARVEVNHHDRPNIDPTELRSVVAHQAVEKIESELPPQTNSYDDDELLDVLDLLLPDGFKARHLPAIEAWKAATKRLLNEVR